MSRRDDESRQFIIKSGYDHYWNFHKDEKAWAKKGCRICIMKQKENHDDRSQKSGDTHRGRG